LGRFGSNGNETNPGHANLDSAETRAARRDPCPDWIAPGYYCHNNYSLETIYVLVLN